MNWDDEFFKSMNNIHDEKRQHELEYERLAAGCIGRRSPEVGERVLVNGGLLHCGHIWDRHEGVVLQVSENAAEVQYTDSLFKRTHTRWVPLPVITDLLGKPAN